MGISFQELMLLLIIGLIVLGPERLPRVANQLGSWLGQARRMTRVMKRQLEEELNLDGRFDALPPARTRHATPGTYRPPVDPVSPPVATSLPPADAAAGDAEQDDSYSPAHGSDDVGTGVGDEPSDEPESAATDPDSGDDGTDAGPAQPVAADSDEPAADGAAARKESA